MIRHATTRAAMRVTLAFGMVSAGEPSLADVPVAVKIARATAIPRCTAFVDAAGSGNGSAQRPHKTIAAAMDAAAPGAVICVAEGTYAEQLRPGTKYFTLAGGFKSGSDFQVRDSALYVSRAKGDGSGSFLSINDPGPTSGQLTAIDGFEITGYSQAIVRAYYEPQRFDITNNYIHHNVCKDPSLAGGGFAIDNVSGTIKGNVIAHNACGRGGAGFFNDGTNKNSLSIENNLVESNAGTEPGASHGGALYGGANKLRVVGNLFNDNSVTQWGAGLWIGAYPEGGQFVTADLAWNVYRNNRAGNKGGGFFCDESATCRSDHEVYDGNCGGNIYLDSGGGSPTVASFDHLTNVNARDVDCKAPGAGVIIDSGDDKTDTYTFTNATFRGNAEGRDIVTGCDETCKTGKVKVTISHSIVQTQYGDAGFNVVFGEGIVAPTDAPMTETKTSPETREATPTVDSADAASAPVQSQPAAVHRETPPVEVAAAGVDDTSVKEAFAAAKDLGTIEAWNAFLTNYPKGFHADLARAYIKKLGGIPPSITAAPSTAASPTVAPSVAAPSGKSPTSKAEAEAGAASAAPADLPPTDPNKAAVARGGAYMGFPEKFNRYYTDPEWKPSKVVYVSPDGTGDGTTRETPMAAAAAIAAARPGTGLLFARGRYKGGLEFTKENSGTYDDPIVIFGERNDDGSLGVSVDCTIGSRQTCLNLEDADYIAMDGFELVGGRYGIRVVGADTPASRHARGAAILRCTGHDQDKDPFFSGQADWIVWERSVAYGAKKGDGHGFYISNGSDWNIARFNETFGNVSSDFQVNASPNETCKEAGIVVTDPRCDAYAGTGEGGQGASDYLLVDSNFFHDGDGTGANFTSVRRSIVRNNIFGPQARHNVSFWQETDNPKLGSSDNRIVHNLFVTNGRHGVQFIAHSSRNLFANNVILGIKREGGHAAANPSALLMGVDATVGANTYRANLYVAGRVDGRAVQADEATMASFSPDWFTKFPAALSHDPNDFTPAPGAPFLNRGRLSSDASADRNGVPRAGLVDLGPIEVP